MSIERKFGKEAHEFCEAIKRLAGSEVALENFESYIGIHFDNWLAAYCRTPDGIVSEFNTFADIK